MVYWRGKIECMQHSSHRVVVHIFGADWMLCRCEHIVEHVHIFFFLKFLPRKTLNANSVVINVKFT